jgi:hypothetical protein
MCVPDAVDTACSSSLVTTHLAAKALMSGEVAAAASMGVNLTLVQSWTRACLRAGMLSEEGRCAYCFFSFCLVAYSLGCVKPVVTHQTSWLESTGACGVRQCGCFWFQSLIVYFVKLRNEHMVDAC